MTTVQNGLVLSQGNCSYWEFSPEQWSCFSAKKISSGSSSLMKELLSSVQPATRKEVMNILIPLAHLLNARAAAARSVHQVKENFLGLPVLNAPYVIGVSGSVAVGKSTFARTLSSILEALCESQSVQLVTTDSFLFSLKELNNKNILHRKGFPESYDKKMLYEFLYSVCIERRAVNIPIYSHVLYDIVPEVVQQVQVPDILVLEGLNVLQNHDRASCDVLDFIDFSIYVDAPADTIRSWYIDRFVRLKNTAFQSSESYFNKFRDFSNDEAISMAADIWERVNLKNLVENILPTRDNASLIVQKKLDHSVERLFLRVI
ncbi:type I pantothenate kinase [Pseudomonas sp. SDO55104_S430]